MFDTYLTDCREKEVGARIVGKFGGLGVTKAQRRCYFREIAILQKLKYIYFSFSYTHNILRA